MRSDAPTYAAVFGVDAAALAMLLERELERRAVRVLARATHEDRELEPERTRRRAEHSGAWAFSAYTAEPCGTEEPSAILQRAAHDDDSTWFAAISQATGGWVLALCEGEPGTIVGFHAGRLVEQIAISDRDARWAGFRDWYRLVAGHGEWDLQRPTGPGARSWILADAPAIAPRVSAPLVSAPLRRGLLGNCELARIQARVGAALRCVERTTPVAAFPWVLIEGEFTDAWFVELARGLGVFALAFEIGPRGYEGRGVICQPGRGHDALPRRSGLVALAEAQHAVTITMGEPPAIVRAPAIDPRPPGMFDALVRAGTLDADALGKLLRRLPDEHYVSTEARGGEAFDSRRWPLACDAALATWLARMLDDPEGRIAQTEDELDLREGVPEAIDSLARDRMVRLYAAMGMTRAMLVQIMPKLREDELAILAEPTWPLADAQNAADLAAAHHHALDGLFAYHVHRGLAGPSADAAANLAKRALAAGRIDVAGLVDLAIWVRWPPIPLDPPSWFWAAMHEDRDALREALHNLELARLPRFFALWRDLATQLADPVYTRERPGISDEAAFEQGAHVVSLGRAVVRAVLRDPRKLPSVVRAPRLELPGEVYFERTGVELPTDVVIEWFADGSTDIDP
ncbi:hypothetical protein ACNOYE_13170 [Nannocystaceae bacterium ST9]